MATEDVITNRDLAPGTVLVARYRSQVYRLRYQDEAFVFIEPESFSAKLFRSPSAAGREVTGSATNGWRFFQLDDGSEPARTPRTRKAKSAVQIDDETAKAAVGAVRAKKATQGKPVERVRMVQRMPNQKGAAEGMTRYYCSWEADGFQHPTGQTFDACPQCGRPVVDESDSIMMA